ncbi:MAG: hypothetical protein M3299_01925 [Thermoproteota archaeon]|nr:hypothetical protein [Thermoproteota archaeon]
MTTSPHKLSSSLTGKASVLTLLMVAGILFTAPSAMAQQIPLTPEELEQQTRLQNVIAATTRNLEQGEKEVNGVVFTPRWSNPVWVEADSLSILFVYCLPGEFADSGQEILGGSELEVLESYALALTGDLMVWFAVVENENENIRLPAAVGVICASDLNQAEIRVLSPQEQQEINNIIRQFITIQNTQVTNIENVINIINNVTTNGTTTGPVTPPTNDTVTPPPTNDTVTPPPTNDTVTPTECPLGTFFNATSGQCEFIQIFPEEPDCPLGSVFNATSGQCEFIQIFPEEPGGLAPPEEGVPPPTVGEGGDTGRGPQGGVTVEPTEEPPSGNDTGGG